MIDDINYIIQNSKDPKVIGNLLFPLARIHNGIKKAYNEQKPHKKDIYIVLTLNELEIKTLNTIRKKDICFSFASFIRGFTS